MSRIADIENAIMESLEDSKIQVRNIDINRLTEGVYHPACFIGTDMGEFSKRGQITYHCELNVYLVLVFHAVSSEKDRRHGLYPILEGVILKLAGKKLGLDLDKLTPKSFRNVTDKAFRDKNLCAYELLFQTATDFKEEEEDTASQLLTLALGVYLQDPVDDGVADAETVFNTGQ